jgi:hypothetical protein
MLAWYTDDPGKIARLVAQSGLSREKWARADYRGRTIETALVSVGVRRAVCAERAAGSETLIARELGV